MGSSTRQRSSKKSTGPTRPQWQEATVEQRYAAAGVAYAAVEFEDYYADAADGALAHSPARPCACRT